MRGHAVWMAGIIAVLSLGVIVADPQPPEAARFALPAFKPVQPVAQIMEGQDLLLNGVKFAVKNGKWSDAIAQAWVLAELGNVNTQHARDGQYAEFARAMSDASSELARTLMKKNVDEAKKGISAVAARCEACHQKYAEEK